MPIKPFIQTLYPDILAVQSHLGIVLFCGHMKIDQFFSIPSLDQAGAWVKHKLEYKRDVYYTVSLQDPLVNASEKKVRSNKGAAAIFGVWADIDIADGTEAHKASNLPNEDEARAFLAALPVPPSLIVRSGHGFHVYWILTSTWIFQGQDDHDKAAALVKEFQATLRKMMNEKGWSLDSTADLARLLRIPGTFNFKCDPPKEVVMEDPGEIRRYTREALEAFAGREVEPVKQKKGKAIKTVKVTHKIKAPAHCGGILKGCAFIKDCQKNAGTLPEPLWYSAVTVLAHAEDGPAVIHKISAPYPGYSIEETDQKIAHALADTGPMTCNRIAEITADAFCGKCSFRRRITSPIQLGAPPFNGEKEVLFLTCELDEELRQVEASLAKCPELFHRGGKLVRVVDNLLAGPPGAMHPPLEIQEVHTATLREILCSVQHFCKQTQTAVKATYPPDPLVIGLLERRTFPHVRHLRGITVVPVLRPDGTVLQQAGYDPVTELLLEPCAVFPRVPDNPTYDEVKAAVRLLLEVVVDFPFADEHAKAVFLAMVLTPVGRFAFRGPSPMFLIDANIPGVGKTKIADNVGIITTGRTLPRATQTRNEEEERKRITSILLKGWLILLIDNISFRLGSGVLDALLTSETWLDRILGGNREVTLPNNLMVIGTGNNLEYGADLVRRILRIQLVTKDEHPEARSDFHHPDLEAWVGEHQPELLVAALTILRGYVVAQRPRQKMITLGSYTGWSELIQASVKWATGMDAGEARIPFSEGVDLDSEVLHYLMAGWKELAPDGEAMTCGQVIQKIERSNSAGKAIIDAMDLAIPGSKHTSTDLGRLLRKYKKRVRDGFHFDHAGSERSSGGWRWHLIAPLTTSSAHEQCDAVCTADPFPEVNFS